MVAAKLATMQKGGDRGNQHTGGKASIDALPQSEVAEMLNVSRPSVQRATKVVKSGDEKLIADVESGEVTVSAAAKHVAAVTTKQKRPAPLASLLDSVTCVTTSRRARLLSSRRRTLCCRALSLLESPRVVNLLARDDEVRQ